MRTDELRQMDGGDEMDAAMSWSRDPAFRPEWAAADGMPFPEWCEVYHDCLWAEYHETGSCYDTDWEVWLERSYERKGGRLS